MGNGLPATGRVSVGNVRFQPLNDEYDLSQWVILLPEASQT